MNKLRVKPTVSRQRTVRFGETSFELLSDFLSNINNQNKSNLENVSSVSGSFKARSVAGESNSLTPQIHELNFYFSSLLKSERLCCLHVFYRAHVSYL